MLQVFINKRLKRAISLEDREEVKIYGNLTI